MFHDHHLSVFDMSLCFMAVVFCYGVDGLPGEFSQMGFPQAKYLSFKPPVVLFENLLC